jgi:hypothetical protein
MKKIALLLFLVPFYAGAAGAFDFGVLLDQTAGVEGIGGDWDFDYSASLIPWFSTPLGDSGDLFVSAGLTAGYEDKEGFFVPELLRTEFSWRFSNALRLRAGRLSYADPLNFVVDGLLDGAQVFYNTAIGTFNAGFMYSGLLYKKTTKITMTADDIASYYDKDRYLTSWRMLMAVGWEHPALGELVRLRTSLTGQLDVNGRDTAYHSQYLTVKAHMLIRRFVFELGGALQLAQDIAQDEREFDIALAAELGTSWELPTSFKSQLSFNGRFSSGRTESGSIAAFVPVTTMDQGEILKAKLSGLSTLNLDYTARFHRDWSSSLDLTYFVRSDLGTYMGYPWGGMVDNEGYFLGGELFGRVIWSPVSDLRLNAGGGVFLPAMGNVAPDAKPLWRVELNIIFMLY